MNDSKWEKLLGQLTDELGEIFVLYKLVYTEELFTARLDLPDDKPFFSEPIQYKEVEWIKLPANYQDYALPDHRKAGKRVYEQDLERIAQLIQSIGTFALERTPGSVKLYGYR